MGKGIINLTGVLLMGLFSISCGQNVRRAAVAGSFYPGDAKELRAEVERLISSEGVPEEANISGKVLAITAPHAGYVFSAGIASAGYRLLRQSDADTIVVIGHDLGRAAPGIPAVFCDSSGFETPLGVVEVDLELLAAMRKALPKSVVHNRIHAQDHTVEVHLPFLQVLKPGCKILPVMFGEVTEDHCRQFAEALKACEGNRKILVLASTDLSHYPPAQDARVIDDETLRLIESADLPGLLERRDGSCLDMDSVQTAICSAGGVGVAMYWAAINGGNEIRILSRGTSGDIPRGDKRRVVGYGSAAFLRSGDKPAITVKTSQAKPQDADGEGFSVPADVQAELLKLVRRRIASKLAFLPWSYKAPESMPSLQEPAAVFVTLTKGGHLRGCIGTTVAREPLYKTVERFALSAAFEDPRFSAVTANELNDLKIEISVLSPMKLASSHEEIVPGKTGVMIRKGSRSGLFLPQVWEQLPDKEQFMGCLCAEKAGLPPDAWKGDDVNLYLFTVFAFEED